MKRNLLLAFLFILSTQHLSAQCNAAFTSSVNNDVASFTATASAPNIYHSWNFGDGSGIYYSGPVSNVSHTYNSGSYTVLHLVKDTITNCTDSSWHQVNVQFTPECHAAFNVVVVGHYLWGNQYNFVNTSTNTGVGANYTWTVNNGAPSGTVFNAYYPDTVFHVCLTVTTANGCSSSSCQDIVVPPIQSCGWTASFAFGPFSNNPALVSFVSSPVAPNMNYLWNFGDGNFSTQAAPIHLYNASGNYNVGLIMHDTVNNCIDSSFQMVQVRIPIPDTCSVVFSCTTNSQGVTQFFPIGSPHIASYSWWIDSTLFTSQSPLYSFTDTLPHNVCLTVVTDSGCSASFCQSVTIFNLIGGRVSGERLITYPNPAVNTNDIRVNIGLDKPANIVYKIYTAGGQPVATGQQRGLQGNNNIRIPIGSLRPGQYYVELIYNDQRKRSIFIKL